VRVGRCGGISSRPDDLFGDGVRQSDFGIAKIQLYRRPLGRGGRIEVYCLGAAAIKEVAEIHADAVGRKLS